jgi:uncharacterized protein
MTRVGDINARDSNGMTALIRAVDSGQHPMVRLLLSRKAAPDYTDKWGQTALMLAAGRNDLVSIELLIAATADLKVKAKNGLTALGYAEENGQREAAMRLKKAGARR